MKKFLTGAAISATLLFTAGTAMAGGGHHGHGHGHGKHHWKESKHYNHYAPPRYVVRRDVHHYYAPSYYAPPPPVYRPSAGIHVVLPNVYIPLR